LTEERVDFAYITELPPRPQPKVTRYRVWVCRCTGCGRKVRGEHPDLAPDQYGATAHRVGPLARAAAHALHYQVGIPVRPDSIGVPLVLGLLTGLELTQGAITQDALRQARGPVGATYQRLRAGVRESPVVYTDDTGWKVGGESAQLMAFDTDEATVYQVRARHRHQEVQEVIPRNYPGVMGTDRGRSYEDQTFRRAKQSRLHRDAWPICSEPWAKSWSGRKGDLGTWRKGLENYCGWRWGCGRSTATATGKSFTGGARRCA
jgi:transposase